MTRISAQLGDVATDDGFSSVVFRALERDAETNQTSLAVSLNWPEQTLRGFRDGKSSPRFDALCARRTRMPLAMFLDVLQTLAGNRAVVLPAELFEPTDRPAPAAVLAKAIESLHELTEFIEEVQQRGVDGIDRDDVAKLASEANDVHRVLVEAVLTAYACAGMPRPRSRLGLLQKQTIAP